jgi:hypothetical protein
MSQGRKKVKVVKEAADRTPHFEMALMVTADLALSPLKLF